MELSLPGAEAAVFDSGLTWATVTQATVDQKFVKAVIESTFGTYSDDYTFEQLHTVPTDELEDTVNGLLAQQATMILSSAPEIICLDFVDIHYHGCPYCEPGELCRTTPRDGTSQCHRYLAVSALARAKPLIVAVTGCAQ